MTNVAKRLDDLVELRPEKSNGLKDPARPYIGLEHIAQGAPQILGSLHSSESTSTNNLFEKDDILFGKLRPNLRKSVRASFAGYCSTDILVLRSRQGVVPAFVGHVFQWEEVFNAAAVTAAGTKMPRTSWNDLRRFRVSYPKSPTEQRAIAAALDLVDATIAKTGAVIAKLKQVRAGLLHDLLTRGLDDSGELRDPLKHPEQFQDSPLGRMPTDWDTPSLSRLCSFIGSGVTPRGGQEVYTSDGVLFIRSQNVTFDGLKLADVAYIPETIHRVMRRSEVIANDVLFNITGASIGRCCVAPATLEKANVNQHVCIVRVPKAESADGLLLAEILGSYIGQRQLDALNTCGNRQGLNYQQLGAFVIPWPMREERSAIASKLLQSTERITCEVNELAKLTKLKSGLMCDLLSGRVCVPETIAAESIA